MNTPDVRVRELLDRRDFLLRSIDDLEREYAAGDMAKADFDLLHRDYSTRAATVLRDLQAAGHKPAAEAHETPTPVKRAIKRKARILKGIAAAGIVAFAGISGISVAKLAGVRSSGDGLTGAVETVAPSRERQVDLLLQKGRENMATEPLTALESFDAAAQLDPKLAEAHAYGGWLLRLVSLSANDEANRKELLQGAITRIDRAIEVDPKYPDARAFRAIIRLRDLDDPKAALEDFAIMDTMNVPGQIAALIGNARVEAEEAAKSVGQ